MLWAVLSVLLISIITAGIVLVCRTYYVREEEQNRRLQAEFYAQSAIELISDDIVKNGDASSYISGGNTTDIVDVRFGEGEDGTENWNWSCKVTINHSLVNESDPKNSGIIYLTARVSRNSAAGADTVYLAEVCYKLKYDNMNGGWTAVGYYNL